VNFPINRHSARKPDPLQSKLRLTWLMIVMALLAVSCSKAPPPGEAVENPPTSSPLPVLTSAPPLPEAEITFKVRVPQGASGEDSFSINILDEVTGLALNPVTYPLETDKDGLLTASLRFPVGSVVKYRYTRHTSTATLIEHTSDGRPVRYRLYHVQGPGNVEDVVSRWTDTQFAGGSGRISGRALDALSGRPIPGLLITAGGSQCFTSADGSYLLEGLPPGTHNLVAYSLDGAYRTFQQGAIIAADSTTPAELRLQPSALVQVTFTAHMPEDAIPGVPIRIAGNLYQLGNTFADLAGGVSTLGARMPVLNPQPDGTHRLTLALPVGADIRYTYTLGDGFWNTELTSTGAPRLRQLIVPESDVMLSDKIERWRVDDTAPITFDVTVPADTPPEDTISIQFNPFFGWMEPIPMWRLTNNRWAYVLNGPIQVLGNISYRFCRNGQCGSADDATTAGLTSAGYPVEMGILNQTTVKQVSAWMWWNASVEPPSEDAAITPRGAEFVSGIEYQPSYHPSWLSLYPQILNDLQSIGGNWTVLTPTWTYTRLTPPLLEPLSGTDPLWQDIVQIISQTLARGQKVALFPTPHFLSPVDNWWSSAPRDYPWWTFWFERYRNFVLHHADLAEQSGAKMLILGGEWLEPALTGGMLVDGTPSNVPADADARWRNLLQEVRSRYHGTVAWALSYEQAVNNPPAMLDAVDAMYIQFSPALANYSEATMAELYFEAARLLDVGLLPLQSQFGIPVILSIRYPSADGAATACLASAQEECLDWGLLAQPHPDLPEITVDLEEQVEIYRAILRAVNERPWINGVVSAGYYPPVRLMDKSPSVHGKPAEGVLKYWFSGFLSAAP